MNHLLRITLGLALGGAIFGALAGSAIVAIVPLFVRAIPPGLFIAIGAGVGAVLGAVLFPTAGWLVMRHVPIGKALVGTFLGTVVGGVIGGAVMVTNAAQVTIAETRLDPLMALSGGAVVGFLASILLLRLTAGRAKRPEAEAAKGN
jgi:hypothetical protein